MWDRVRWLTGTSLDSDTLEVEWKWNGSGMEGEWKWNGNEMEMEWKGNGSGMEMEFKVTVCYMYKR